MDKILERYERYSYAEKVLVSGESETQVLTSFICFYLICYYRLFSFSFSQERISFSSCKVVLNKHGGLAMS
jgi:hypothetical protein